MDDMPRTQLEIGLVDPTAELACHACGAPAARWYVLTHRMGTYYLCHRCIREMEAVVPHEATRARAVAIRKGIMDPQEDQDD